MSPGEFIWHELWSADPPASAAFYGAVFGWRSERHGSTWTLYPPDDPDLPTAVIRPARSDAPPHWAACLEVTDLDAAVDLLVSAGAVILDCAPLGGGGDDHGVSVVHPDTGQLGLIRPNGPPTATTAGFAWHQLDTPDPAAAGKLYGRLAGWVAVPIRPRGVHIVRGRTAHRTATWTLAPPALPAQWICYLIADDLTGAAERALEHGGGVVAAHAALPPLGATCLLRDPDGLLLGCSTSVTLGERGSIGE